MVAKPKPMQTPPERPAVIQSPEIPDFDRLIHEKTRLAIVSVLAVNSSLTHNELKQTLNMTDGNVSVHARKLEDAGYLMCRKSFEGRMPKTEYSLTPSGRAAFQRYLGHMEALIKATKRE